MKNKNGKIGSLLLIFLFLIIIIGIGGFVFFVINTDTDNNIDSKTIKEINEKKKKEEERINKLEGKDNFLKVISTLKYVSDKRYIDYQVIEVDLGNKVSLYNPETKKLVLEDLNGSYEWFGTFGIVYGDENKIIDSDGNILFTSHKEFAYYDLTDTWIFDNTLINNKEEIVTADNIELLDIKNNKYFITTDKRTINIIDYTGKIVYSKEIGEKIDTIFGSMGSIYDTSYALINYNNYYGVINPNNGKVIIDFTKEEIERNDNVFFTDDKTYFIKDDKIAIELNKRIKKIELSKKYIALDNDVYDYNNLNLVDSNTYIDEKANIEILMNTEKTSCRMGYGLKHNNKEILECNYDDIVYFDEDVTKALISANKYYVIIKEEDNYKLYDVVNNIVIVENIIDFDSNSSYVVIAKGEDVYIYNIINGKEILNKYGDSTELGYNYYALLREGKIIFYNSKDEVVYEGKI